MGQAVIAIIVGALCILCLYFVGVLISNVIKRKRSISPQVAKNRAREKAFLEKVLTDIHANKDTWFLVENIGTGSLLANNDRNIGIVYQGTDHLTILLNLDRLDEFQRHDENTVKLMMIGPHVKKFVTEAEQLIDKRGDELRFFADEFDRRL